MFYELCAFMFMTDFEMTSHYDCIETLEITLICLSIIFILKWQTTQDCHMSRGKNKNNVVDHKTCDVICC